MRLFLLSLLAVGSVHSMAVGYPYKSALVGYVPARGEFPVQSSVVQGYVRYVDSHGVERLVPYSYPEPLYGVRQISYVGGVPAAEVVHKPVGDVKTYGVHQAPLTVPVHVSETPEQSHAREEHLRIYNEQIKHWQELQEQHGRLVSEAVPKVHHEHAAEQSVKQVSSHEDGLKEIERATQEHLRLWNEAKLRAEEASKRDKYFESKSHESVEKSHDHVQRSGHEVNEVVDKVHSTQVNSDHVAKSADHAEVLQPKYTNVEVPQSVSQKQHGVADTPEVVKAREEHLRLVEEAKAKVASVEQNADHEHYVQVPQVKSVVHDVHPAVTADTPEVVKAREEHLRLVQEVQAKVQSAEQLGRTVTYSIAEHAPQEVNVHPQIEDTPEVVKAREEHLRLVNEAKLKAQAVEHQQTDSVHSAHPEVVHPEETPEVSQAREQHLRIFNEVKAHVEKEQKSRSELGLETPEQILPKEEDKILELERLREAERLKEEQKQLELERMREAERLAEEQRQMEAELLRLKQEEEERLAMDLLEQQRQHKAEQEQLKQSLIAEEYKSVSTPDTLVAVVTEKKENYNEYPQLKSVVVDSQVQQSVQPVQPQVLVQTVVPQYGDNPFLKNLVVDPNDKPLLQVQQPLQVQNPFLKNLVVDAQANQFVQVQQPAQVQPQVETVVVQTAEPVARYIQSSQQSLGTKHQHVKDDSIKIPSADHASYQPADTATALIHWEKARQEHFRAHEQALEQLRLAREQTSPLKDCNH
ncbi:golgin subfamily A member 6-like protein 22 [Musca vetustissima]|uniref:golgin subfamily A member 6-like protein 22 n=1 Tax=Musca vetustissima TaxID=27455 RepID=UPI002AB7088E|nr:golgin subfamily A member 6-like protein 22 [Musca vetustissima]